MKPDNETKKNLLDVLKETVGCDYLSDLHSEIYAERTHLTLQRIAANRFTMQEWQETALYLTGHKMSGDTAQAVKNALCAMQQK
ncbi:MAG: hypothetical protein RSC58_03755 [Ruthenibacterium sp.]